MGTKLLELQEGILVEVQASADEVQEISGGVAEKINAAFEKVHPLLVKICSPIAAAMKEINQSNTIDKAEVELGLSFEGEGNLYVTKATTGANLTVRLSLKLKE